jgi:hypothetical protein
VALFVAAPSASAQMVLAQLDCSGSYADYSYRGLVLVDLWRTGGPLSSREFYQLAWFLKLGTVDKIPGQLHVFGDMRDQLQNIVNFEVFLHPNGEGTGSLWFNGKRHRETFMKLVVRQEGFTIYPETGGVAEFTCRQYPEKP